MLKFTGKLYKKVDYIEINFNILSIYSQKYNKITFPSIRESTSSSAPLKTSASICSSTINLLTVQSFPLVKLKYSIRMGKLAFSIRKIGKIVTLTLWKQLIMGHLPNLTMIDSYFTFKILGVPSIFI